MVPVAAHSAHAEGLAEATSVSRIALAYVPTFAASRVKHTAGSALARNRDPPTHTVVASASPTHATARGHDPAALSTAKRVASQSHTCDARCDAGRTTRR